MRLEDLENKMEDIKVQNKDLQDELNKEWNTDFFGVTLCARLYKRKAPIWILISISRRCQSQRS